MKLTYDSLMALFNCGAPNRPQAMMLGLTYPLREGWVDGLIGTEIPDDRYEFLMSIKGRRPPGMPKAKWRNLHKEHQ